MLTPEESRDIKPWHPDEIKSRAKNSITFMWSPTGGLFVGWPMDHDPTRPGRRLPPGQSFRPNHAEIMMMDPNFAEKFFVGRPDFLQAIRKEPWKLRGLLDQYGLSGRVGREIMIAGKARTICGFWQSLNFDKCARQCLRDLHSLQLVESDAIIYPWKSEPTTFQDLRKILT